MVQLNSNLEGYEKLEELTPLPPGEYPVVILNSELRETRTGNSMVVLTYEVTAAPHQGRKVFDNLNLFHTNSKAVEIAHRTLKSIAIACGHPNSNYIGDTSELHGREMIIKVAIRKDDQNNDRQDIKAYRAKGATPGAAVPPAAPGAAVPPVTPHATPPVAPPAPPAPPAQAGAAPAGGQTPPWPPASGATPPPAAPRAVAPPADTPW